MIQVQFRITINDDLLVEADTLPKDAHVVRATGAQGTGVAP